MPLVDIADYVGGIEDLKLYMGYGLPQQYPLGMSGLGCGADCACGPCSKKAGNLGDWVPTEEEVKTSTSAYPLGQAYFNPPARQGGAGPQSPFQQKVDTVVGGAQKLGVTLLPFFQRPPKNKIIVEKQQDYTTYAVIGGAVIVASVLAIAVGKSGKRN